MGKKSKNKKVEDFAAVSISVSKNCKTKCCKKYKKGESKRCSRCPKFDLLMADF